MMSMMKIETIEELEALVKRTSLTFFLNIVETCPISHGAIPSFKRIAVKKEKCQHITYTYKRREMFRTMLQSSTALSMNLRKCYT